MQAPTLSAFDSLSAGADALSRYIDWRDRSTCILFGDGCGAVVLRERDDGSDACALLGMDMHSGGQASRSALWRVRPASRRLHTAEGPPICGLERNEAISRQNLGARDWPQPPAE